MNRSMLSLACLAALCTSALAQPTLTVYTYDSFASDWGPGAKVKAAFEKTCGCTVDYQTAADGVALLNKLKLEGRNTKADVVLGLDTTIMADARATSLFGPHKVDVALAKVPGGWTDTTFLPFDYAWFAVVYDSEKMKTPPASLDALVNGDPAQKIILEDPRSSTPGLGFLLWMKAVYGDKAKDAWQKLKPRVLTTTPGWTEAYGLFTKGEAPMVLSYTTSPAYHIEVDKTERYKAAAFSEGHVMQVEIAGLIDGSPERALAEQFMAFMLSPGFQNEIPTTNWMFPAGETTTPLPPAFSTLVMPAKTLGFPPEEVQANRAAWTDEWLATVND